MHLQVQSRGADVDGRGRVQYHGERTALLHNLCATAGDGHDVCGAFTQCGSRVVHCCELFALSSLLFSRNSRYVEGLSRYPAYVAFVTGFLPCLEFVAA